VDPALNRASARKLRALDPAVVAFGHGPPLRDLARFHAFIDRLPTP
jgi:glyoxylase-like metal-dependent hydrolase (beta-lactamase superfamily II)